MYLVNYDWSQKNILLFFSFISFFASIYNLVTESFINVIFPIALVSSVFSLMMIGHWFLVDPTIK